MVLRVTCQQCYISDSTVARYPVVTMLTHSTTIHDTYGMSWYRVHVGEGEHTRMLSGEYSIIHYGLSVLVVPVGHLVDVSTGSM